MTIKVGHISNPANQVRINDPSVSRMHLEVSKIDNDTLRIVDLGSTNGTRYFSVHSRRNSTWAFQGFKKT
ncbi:MAG: FHA domain-containing protein [Saprospiraceae bacterium]|nr:FHA domain-containing protein [Saprospiraceae bacterium]